MLIEAIACNLNIDACAAKLGLQGPKLQSRLDARGITRVWVDTSIPLIIDRRHDRRRYNGLIRRTGTS